MPKKKKATKTNFLELAFQAEHNIASVPLFDNSREVMEWSASEVLIVAGSMRAFGDAASGSPPDGRATIGNEELADFLYLLAGRLRGLNAVLGQAALEAPRK